MKLLLGLLLALLGLTASAAEFRAFGPDSRKAIERTHAGRPFVLAFWSIDCAYCAEELQQLRRLAEAQPAVALVLVSTDSAERSPEAGAMLDRLLGGARAERWMFSGDAERLVFAVDRKWRGELPRAYFYDAAGTPRTVAGKVPPPWLEQWAGSCARAPACP